MDCSPGYWKNHTEVWDGFDDGLPIEEQCCIGSADDPTSQCGMILINLEARGPGSVVFRSAAADFLDACFVDSPCDE